MKVALARQQSVTQHRPRSLECPALDEFVCIHNENVAYEFGMIDEVNGERSHPEMRDVAELCLLSEEGQPVVPEHRVTAVEPSKFLRRRQLYRVSASGIGHLVNGGQNCYRFSL